MKIILRFGPDQMARSLALAHAFAETEGSSEIILISSECPPISHERMRQIRVGATGFSSWDTEETESALEDCEILVLDNAPDEQLQKAVRRKARVVALIQDEPAGRICHGDCVVNPNLNAHLLEYPDIETFLGTEFYALGPEFDEFIDAGREIPEKCRKIAIHMGFDRKGDLVRLVRRMKAIKESFIANICLGGGYQHGQALAAEIGLDGRFMVADRSARRLSGADLAIACPSTLNEMIFFGIPTLLCAKSAISDYAVRSGICIALHDSGTDQITSLMKDRSGRQRMSDRMKELVDGLGRYRLSEELLRIRSGK